MPAVETEHKHFRIDLPHSSENRVKVEKWCESVTSCYLIAEEKGKKTQKPHYQGLVMSDLTKYKLGQSLKTWFELTSDDNRTWACGQCTDTEKYAKYLKKDNLFRVIGYDISDVGDWVPESEYTKLRSKKESKPNFYESMKQCFIDDGVKTDVKSITTFVYNYFSSHSKIFDEFILIRFVNLLISQFGDEQIKKDYISNLCSKINERYNITYGLNY